MTCLVNLKNKKFLSSTSSKIEIQHTFITSNIKNITSHDTPYTCQLAYIALDTTICSLNLIQILYDSRDFKALPENSYCAL